MIEDTYTAPNGRSLKWRTYCDDDCQRFPRPKECEDCGHEIGSILCTDADGVRQWGQSGVIVQRTIDTAVAELKREALAEMQPPLFVLDTDAEKAYTENVETEERDVCFL